MARKKCVTCASDEKEEKKFATPLSIFAQLRCKSKHWSWGEANSLQSFAMCKSGAPCCTSRAHVIRRTRTPVAHVAPLRNVCAHRLRFAFALARRASKQRKPSKTRVALVRQSRVLLVLRMYMCAKAMCVLSAAHQWRNCYFECACRLQIAVLRCAIADYASLRNGARK